VYRIGAAGIIFGLPLLVYLSVFLCNDVSGCPAPSLLHPKSLSLAKLKAETPWPKEGISGLVDVEVIGWVLAYYGLSLVMQLVLPGVESTGIKLDSGGRHTYKFNSFPSALLILAACGVGTFLQGTSFPVWTFIWDKLPQIITANLIISYVIAVYVYIRSFTVPHPGQSNPSNRELAKGGHSGNMIYDFFIGRELNPRIDIPSSIPLIGGQSLDIKLFCELRPGFLGWILLDLAFVAHQYREHGTISDSILLITAFQTLYVLDALYMEPALLTTMDVTTDGFGFMLAFGDLVWLPFIYSLQSRYLAVHPVHLGLTGIAGVLAVQGLGYYIFRASNNEKNRFRTDPKDPRVKHLQSIPTHTGSRLLTSGWWGTARHINYFGDWIMSWSYSLPTGVAGYLINKYTNPLTGNVTREVVQGDARGWGMIFSYFYILYFAILLIHRERRDEEKCKRKYGADWDKYTSKVRSRIVPGVY
jgi:Delta14-sterol reductase